jgi:pimeloyl-ACP methyl ester carboxylesterase
MIRNIIAIHGAGMSGEAFGALASSCAAALPDTGFHAVTLPGHYAGDAAAALLPTAADMAQWLMTWMDARPLGDVILLGHSMGAAVALLAARHARVAGVVALGGAGRMPVNPELLAVARDNPEAAQDLMAKWSCDPTHPHADEIRRLTVDIMRHVPAAAVGADLAACNALPELPVSPRPVLVISGALDRMVPPDRGGSLAGAQNGAHLVLPAGHMMILEKPVEIAAAVADFAAAL